MTKLRLKSFFKTVLIFVLTFCISSAIFYFIRFPHISGPSMLPTYDSGSQLVVLYTKSVSRNDVIIIWSDELNEFIVKRVIGVGGDTIKIHNHKLYRNGEALYEGYLQTQDWISDFDKLDIVVPQNEVFVMGDNRKHSIDSRVIGTLSVDDIFGKVLFEINSK